MSFHSKNTSGKPSTQQTDPNPRTSCHHILRNPTPSVTQKWIRERNRTHRGRRSFHDAHGQTGTSSQPHGRGHVASPEQSTHALSGAHPSRRHGAESTTQCACDCEAATIVWLCVEIRVPIRSLAALHTRRRPWFRSYSRAQFQAQFRFTLRSMLGSLRALEHLHAFFVFLSPSQ